MSKIISFISFKGGTGKTTAVTNLSYFLQENGGSVLIIDTDPQGNVAHAFGMNPEGKNGLYDLANGGKFEECIQKMNSGVDILFGSTETNYLDFNDKKTTKVIMDKILTLKKVYDYVLIDTRPTPSGLSIELLEKSDLVIIPILLDRFSFEGMKKLLAVKDYKKILIMPMRVMPKNAVNREIKLSVEKIIANKENVILLDGISNSLIINSAVSFKALPLTFTTKDSNKIKSEFRLIAKEIIK